MMDWPLRDCPAACLRLMLLAAVVLSTTPGWAAAASRPFEIGAGSAADTLREFGRQAGLQTLFDYKLARNLRTQAVIGSFEPEDALARMLVGTGLTFKRVDARTVAIRGANIRQDTGQPRNASSSQQSSGNDAASSIGRLTLEEIVVTAQKRAENLQQVPVSISAISSEQLERFHATRLLDVMNYVPGVHITDGGSIGRNIITLRGISPLSPNQTVGVYIDDAPVGSSGFFAVEGSVGTDLLPYDIERIEVLRGPQGTLYGASGNAGLFKYVTRAPDLSNFELRAGTEVFDMRGAGDVGWGGRLGINAPLVEGKVAVRASYAYQLTPGYIDNIRFGIEDQNEVVQEAGRAALLWRASEDVSLKLAGMWQTIDSENNAFSLLDPSGSLYTGDYVLDNQLPEPFEREVDYYTATLDWALGWADFVSATSYSNTEMSIISDASVNETGTSLGSSFGGLSQFLLALDLEKWTQEFRLASPGGGRIEWLLGAFYTDEDSANSQVSSAMTLAGALIPGLNPFSAASLPSTYREYAAFGNLTYEFTERFDVTAGLRWAHDKQEFRQITGGFFFELLGLAGDIPGESSDSVVTYSLAPRLFVNEHTMMYARVASGYRPGGPNIILPDARRQADADLLVSYEIGVKTQLIERRVLVDAAVFRMEWQDIQLVTPAPPPNEERFSVMDNAGEAWSHGVELATTFTPAQALRLGVSAAYTETELTELGANATTFPARSGDSLPLVPQWSASAMADYEFPLFAWRARVGAGYRYVDARLSSFESDPNNLRQDSYTVLDLNGEISADNWTLRLFATNVTDERGQTSLVQAAYDPALLAATLLQPRTLGLSLDLRF